MARSDPNAVLRHLQASLARAKVRDGKILAAVSGGPDSVCLLQALHEIAERYRLTLVAGHLNHRLRGEESDADAVYVERFCHERSLPAVVDAAKGLSPGQAHLESTARRLRYQWLGEVARREGCRWVMTGHTANDQAETVLHHLLRGTGWRGLRGIAPVRPLCDTTSLLRPLLMTTRSEVLAFLASRNITARRDSSNEDARFTRNRLRAVVLPLLEQQVNPRSVLHLTQLAERAREVYPALLRRAKRLLEQARLPEVGGVLVFDQRILAAAEEVVLQDALRLLWLQQDWPVTAMSSRRWREAMAVCRGERGAVQLPAGVRVRRRLHVVHFLRSQ